MPRYEVSIEVTADRLEEIPYASVMEQRSPVKDVAAMGREMGKMMRQIAPGQHPPGLFNTGISMKRMILINAESFNDLAAILGRFDRLAEEIEGTHPME